MRYAVRLSVLFLSAVASLASASAEKRVALVIGNADYRIGRLANPLNDAEAVADAFKSQLKFDTVILRKDLKRDGFVEAVREMARASAGADVGAVFFAGHGIEVGGRNYLIPTDAALATPADIEFEAIALDTVLRQLDGIAKLRLVILDACRNNPFPAAKRSTTRGLGRVEPDGGTLIAYAAKDGTTADDGKAGLHSPFTAALLKRIVTPGLDVRLMFGYVNEDVKVATGHSQVPYLYGQLGGEQVHLVPVAATADAKPPVAPGGVSETVRICRDVEGMSNPATLAVLERLHKGSPAGECAAARLAQLKAAAVVTPPPPKVAEPALAPGRVFRDCPDVCPEMVVVPSGSFTMGSPESEKNRDSNEGPQQGVTIARSFAVGKFEVTFAEWDACVSAGGCSHRPETEWGRGKQPVMRVSWYDTQQYVGWLSRHTGKTYRLLTEAEWEYAARAWTTTRYAFGDTISKSQAQFSEGTWGSAGKTVAVGSFRPNAFGLYDMHGNVWEWVQDCWNDSHNGAPTDGSALATGDCSRRVLRGGSWDYYPWYLRAASRGRGTTVVRGIDLGFRVGRMLNP